MSSDKNARTWVAAMRGPFVPIVVLLAALSLGMGTCGTDSTPTSSTNVGQIDQGFTTVTTSTTPGTTPSSPTTPTGTSCGATGECVCEEGFEPDGQGNCVVIVVTPTPAPTPGNPNPSPGPGGTTTTAPAATTWADVQAVQATSCAFGGCHTTGPISMAQWQAAAPTVIAGNPGHAGGAIPASIISIFTSWQAGGFQP